VKLFLLFLLLLNMYIYIYIYMYMQAFFFIISQKNEMRIEIKVQKLPGKKIAKDDNKQTRAHKKIGGIRQHWKKKIKKKKEKKKRERKSEVFCYISDPLLSDVNIVYFGRTEKLIIFACLSFVKRGDA